MKNLMIALLFVATVCFGFVAITTSDENLQLARKIADLELAGQNAVVISPPATLNEVELAFQKIFTIAEQTFGGDLWLGLQRGDELTAEFFQTMLPLSDGKVRICQSKGGPTLLEKYSRLEAYSQGVIESLATKSTTAGSSGPPLRQSDTSIGLTIDGDASTNR